MTKSWTDEQLEQPGMARVVLDEAAKWVSDAEAKLAAAEERADNASMHCKAAEERHKRVVADAEEIYAAIWPDGSAHDEDQIPAAEAIVALRERAEKAKLRYEAAEHNLSGEQAARQAVASECRALRARGDAMAKFIADFARGYELDLKAFESMARDWRAIRYDGGTGKQ